MSGLRAYITIPPNGMSLDEAVSTALSRLEMMGDANGYPAVVWRQEGILRVDRNRPVWIGPYRASAGEALYEVEMQMGCSDAECNAEAGSATIAGSFTCVVKARNVHNAIALAKAAFAERNGGKHAAAAELVPVSVERQDG